MTPIGEVAELKPCPFCGGALHHSGMWLCHPDNDCVLGGFEFDDHEAAAWNRRATVGVQPTDADCPLGIGWHGEVCFCSAGTCAKCRATNGVQEKRNG